MKFKFLGAILALALAAPAAAQSSLDRIDDWSEARGWEGVGLLMINRRSTCTGALIRSDLVLTAAHCLIGPDRQPIAPSSVDFRASWRNGQAISRRVGRRALIHPGYVPMGVATGDSIYHDLALLQLDMPVQDQTARPFATGKEPQEGAEVSVVSYGSGRNDAASLERGCVVREEQGGVLAMSCSVVPGSSGSPVFAMRNGSPRIVSVISALGYDGTAYGMNLSDHIASLLADFDAGRGVYPAAVQSVRRLKGGSSERTATGGALFLKP